MIRIEIAPSAKRDIELSNRERALMLAFRQLDDETQRWIGDQTEMLLEDDQFKRNKKPLLCLVGGAA